MYNSIYDIVNQLGNIYNCFRYFATDVFQKLATTAKKTKRLVNELMDALCQKRCASALHSFLMYNSTLMLRYFK